MPDLTSLQQKALEVIARVSRKPLESLDPGKSLSGDLEIDSAKGLELLYHLEQALEIEISEEDAVRLATVGDVLHFIATLSPTGPGAPAV